MITPIYQDFASAISCLTSTFSIKGMLDLRNSSSPDWSRIHQTLSNLYKEKYGDEERILIIVDNDWYDNRLPFGILIEGVQRLLNHVDISNFFVELLTTNQEISEEIDCIQRFVSHDPVAMHVNVCQGVFNRLDLGLRPRFDSSQISDKSTLILQDDHHNFLHNNQSACMAPWTQVFVDTDRQVYPCCVSDTALGDLRVSSLEQIWNSSTMRQIRLSMLDGQRHPACKNCHITEDAGKNSYRQYINREMSHRVKKIDNTDEDGKVDKFEINYLHFKFSNLCNLACRTCTPHLSSSWHAISTSFGDIAKHSPALISANDDGALYQKFVQHLDSLDQIKFTGGEPLIMQEFYDILDLLVEKNRTDIGLFYNTNMMQLNYRGRNILDIWQKFSNVVVGASLDAEGSRGEYMRSFSKWNMIIDNIKELKKNCPHVYFFVSATVSILNVYHLPDLHRSLIEQKLIEPGQFDINTVIQPNALTVLSCPPELQEIVRVRYQMHISWLQNVDRTARSIGAFNGVLNLLGTGDPFDPPAFWTYIDRLDRYHKTNLLTTFPELAILPKNVPAV